MAQIQKVNPYYELAAQFELAMEYTITKIGSEPQSVTSIRLKVTDDENSENDTAFAIESTVPRILIEFSDKKYMF